MADEPQELYLYKVTIRGVPTQVKLTRKEAKALYGDNAEEIGPANAHQPADAEDTPTASDSLISSGSGAKARTAKNKAASAADK